MHFRRPAPAHLALVLTLVQGLVNSPFAVYLALYAKSLGFTTVQWTALNSVSVLCNSISLLALPALQRRVGSRTLMQVSCVVLMGAFAAIASGWMLAVSVAVLLFGVFTTFFGMCIAITLQSDPSRLRALNSTYAMVNGAASIFAPLIAATVVRAAGYPPFWYLCVAMIGALLVLTTLLPAHNRGESSAIARPGRVTPRFAIQSRLVWLLLGTAVLEPFSFQVMGMYSSLRLSALGLSDVSIGYVAALGSSLYLGSSILAYVFLARMEIRIVYAVALAGAAVSTALFGFSRGATTAIAFLCVYQLFYAWIHSGKNTRHALFATPRLFPSIYSLSISVLSLSSAAVGAISTALVGIIGMPPLIVAGGLFGAAGGIVTLAAPTRTDAPVPAARGT